MPLHRKVSAALACALLPLVACGERGPDEVEVPPPEEVVDEVQELLEDLAAGDIVYPWPLPPDDACPGQGFGWVLTPFERPDDAQACTGEQMVRYDETQELWVGVQRCDDDRVRVYLAGDYYGRYLPAVDRAGRGEDHCALVNPGFWLANEENITSGGCFDCSVGDPVEVRGISVYARATVVEPFERLDLAPPAGHVASRLACGAPLPVCGSDVGVPRVTAETCQVRSAAATLADQQRPSGVWGAVCDFDAGYTESNYEIDVDEACWATRLDVVATAEATSGSLGGEPPRSVTITVPVSDKPRRVALRTYTPVTWIFVLAEGAEVAEVWADGHGTEQEVLGLPASTVVHVNEADGDEEVGFVWEPGHPEGVDGELAAMIDQIRVRAGQIESSFQGCYSATAFVLP